MAKKLDYEHIKKLFQDNGCILLEKTYKDNKSPMKYICKCGRQAQISYSSFKIGRRCIDCGGKKRHDYEYVECFFHEQGCCLLSTEYHNAHTKLNYICKCGSFDSKNFCNFKSGQRCANCKKVKMSKENHWAWQPNRESKKNYDTFKKRIYDIVNRSLRAIKQYKNNHSYDLLGYNPRQLQEHIFSHPNWKKYKDTDWSIDHIFPIKAFVDNGITDLSLINHLDNLQPLPRKQNISKRDTYDQLAFNSWLSKVKNRINIKQRFIWQVKNKVVKKF